MTTTTEPQSILTADCANDCRVTVPRDDRHADTCQWHTPNLGTAWCPVCRGRRQVEDQFTAGQMTARGETEYAVTALACGHHREGPERIVAAAPGAPYADGAYATIRDAQSWANLVARAAHADPYYGEPPF